MWSYSFNIWVINGWRDVESRMKFFSLQIWHTCIKSHNSTDILCQLSSVSSLFSLHFSLSRLNLTNQIMTSFLEEKKSFLKLLQRTSVDVLFLINLEAKSHFWTLPFALWVSQPGKRSIPESKVSTKMKMICTSCYLYKPPDFVYWI